MVVYGVPLTCLTCLPDLPGRAPFTTSCAAGGHHPAEKPKPPVAGTPLAAAADAHVRVLAEIAKERFRQQSVHGWNDAHDDRLTVAAWAHLLGIRVITILAPTIRMDHYRRALLELAAIAEAAIEAHDRRMGGNR